MFWSKAPKKEDTVAINVEKLPGPKDIVDLAGSHMVVSMKKDPDWVWKLKSVSRPVAKKQFYCRVFDDGQAKQAGVTVKDWTSLDAHPELILWEGYCDRETMATRDEKYVKQ